MTPKWPILPNGAVDWQKVYQHPETGLKANVERVDTQGKIKACMHVIVDALFSRDSNAGVGRSFLASINELFTGKRTTLVAKKAKINAVKQHCV